MGQRPTFAAMDDLISDADARSPTVVASIEDTVYKAVDYALHPTRRKTIWSGTPFNAKDPLYKAVESGAWNVNVYPVCEKFPCSREEFRGAWEDRFNYDYVQEQYSKAVKAGMIDTFNQELMLRIMSEKERLILDSDIIWYKRSNVLQNKGAYNFYITTDFATSDKQSADYSVINVWAYNNNGDWLWVDGFCEKALMNVAIDNLFRLSQKYNPLEVGIEVTGQQGGFISWVQSEMQTRNIYFNLSKGKNSTQIGIRPTKDKMSRFQTNAVPLFKSHKIWLPEELKDSSELQELLAELSLATVKGFKSRNDDQIDTVTMLAEINS
jgi:predicted phage terminase large subunit-like protein